MRRGYGATPLQDDEIAGAMIFRDITRAAGFFGVDDAQAVDAMVAATLAAGTAGEFDEIVRSDFYNRDSRSLAGVCELVYNRAHDRGWQQIVDVHALLKLREVTDGMVYRVVESARRDLLGG
jgi:hypothetical protein